MFNKKKLKPKTAEQKLAEIVKMTQFWADRTQVATKAVRIPEGVTYQHAEYPVLGDVLFTAQPIPREERLAA